MIFDNQYYFTVFEDTQNDKKIIYGKKINKEKNELILQLCSTLRIKWIKNAHRMKCRNEEVKK